MATEVVIVDFHHRVTAPALAPMLLIYSIDIARCGMLSIEQIFKNKKAVPERLLADGFLLNDGVYSRTETILDDTFALTIMVADQVTIQVVDCDSGEDYVLVHVPAASGAFVGQVIAACEERLTAIAARCFEPEIFQQVQTRQIMGYMESRYESRAEYLWEKFPNNAVFRRADSKKWYAAILSVQRTKLGLSGEGFVEILDLRCPPEQLPDLIDGKRYFPGYHMNKQHWFTVCLDGSLSMPELEERIEQSWQLAQKPTKTKGKKEKEI